MEWFVDGCVNQLALNHFFEKAGKDKMEIHTLQIFRGGRQLLRLAQEPYACTDAREVYSLSKMFASTVVGIAVDQGLVRTDDKLVDIFKRENYSEKVSHMTLRHLLSMNTGHEQCVMPHMARAESAVEGFFSVEPVYEPGTHFAYNTGASCMLCAVVEKVTGRDFFDFACENLFYPLEITNVSWNRCHDGTCYGGVGLHVCNDDIAKLGLMYSNGGIWQGKRILSEAWIREATSYVSDNSCNGTPDWCSGYGYQIWLNSRDGYRGDGAFGQLCMILPKYDAVVAVQADVESMQGEIDLIMELMDHLIGAENEGQVYSFEPLQSEELIPEMDAVYRMDENPADIRLLRVKQTAGGVKLSFDNGWGIQTITADVGDWTVNRCSGKHMLPVLTHLMTTEYPENFMFAACCCQEGDKTVLWLRYRTNPHKERLEITTEGERIRLKFVEPWGRGLRSAEMACVEGTRI